MLSSGGTGCALECFILIATLETSLEANYERQAGRQEGRQEDRRKKSLIGARATALHKKELFKNLKIKVQREGVLIDKQYINMIWPRH